MKTFLLSFSSRPAGNCAAIAAELRRYAPGEVTVRRFSDFTIAPCGRCGCECFRSREDCPNFGDPVYGLYDAVTRSDFAYFIVPNYCDYPCANFFAFNERSQCYFQGRQALLEQYLSVRKKFVVVSSTGRENFVTAFRYHVPENEEPDILFLSAKQFRKVSIRGDLMDAPEARETLRQFMEKEQAM